MDTTVSRERYKSASGKILELTITKTSPGTGHKWVVAIYEHAATGSICVWAASHDDRKHITEIALAELQRLIAK